MAHDFYLIMQSQVKVKWLTKETDAITIDAIYQRYPYPVCSPLTHLLTLINLTPSLEFLVKQVCDIGSLGTNRRSLLPRKQ